MTPMVKRRPFKPPKESTIAYIGLGANLGEREKTIEEDALEVPHPRLHERRFVLEPLAELDPGLVVPGRGPVSAFLAELE